MQARKLLVSQSTNNYVMFDPERIKVVAKNGEVVRTVADDMPAPVQTKYRARVRRRDGVVGGEG